MNKAQKITIMVLAVLFAAEVGYIVWNEKKESAVKVEDVLRFSVQVPSGVDLTDAERKVFTTRSTNASSSLELERAGENMIDAAVSTSRVTLKSCRATPPVARLPHEGTMTFVNESAQAITLIFLNDHLKIEGGGSVTVGPLSAGPDPERTSRTIAYTCEGESTPVGFVYVSSTR